MNLYDHWHLGKQEEHMTPVALMIITIISAIVSVIALASIIRNNKAERRARDSWRP